MSILTSVITILLTTAFLGVSQDAWGAFSRSGKQHETLLAGASEITINPERLPVYVAGSFVYREGRAQLDDLKSKCIVLDNGSERVVLVVVDSTALPRHLIDRVKQMVSSRTGIRSDRILVSATHTHAAPNAREHPHWRNEEYVQLLMDKIPKGIEAAVENLTPARIGWVTTVYAAGTHTRQYIFRPDKVSEDPFGKRTVRANIHPGFQNPDTIGPTGPSDPELSILSIQTRTGEPIALLANYAQHYYGTPSLADGSPMLSADYFGHFSRVITSLIGGDNATGRKNIVAIMSQGASGDQQWMDYGQPAPFPAPGLEGYAGIVASKTFEAYKRIVYRDWVPLRMAEIELTLDARLPTEEQLAHSRQVVKNMEGRAPTSVSERYATDLLQEKYPAHESIKLQAIALGELAFAAIPNEVFAITGLKIKEQSPLPTTMVIGLANGSNGYLPPPEQHVLGGYPTWVRPHYLGQDSEPKIVESVLGLLERVSGNRRRALSPQMSAYAKLILESKPSVYWQLNELNGPVALDATGRHAARYEWEKGVAFYLDGPDLSSRSGVPAVNRAPQFAGGRLTTELKVPAASYSVELWFWNGLPTSIRAMTGWLFSVRSDSLGIGGQSGDAGKLVLAFNETRAAVGKTTIQPKTWYHLAVVRAGRRTTVYLNGIEELSSVTSLRSNNANAPLIIGGLANPAESFEGKIDEVAIYDRELTELEVTDHFRISQLGL